MTKEEYLSGIKAIEDKAKEILRGKKILAKKYIADSSKCQIGQVVNVFSPNNNHLGKAVVVNNKIIDGDIIPTLNKCNKDLTASVDGFFSKAILSKYKEGNFVIKDIKYNTICNYPNPNPPKVNFNTK